MKRIHHRTLGIYSQLWGYQLNALNGTRLVGIGNRLAVSVTPSVDATTKFRSFYSPSSNLFSSQILPSSTEANEPSTSDDQTKSGRETSNVNIISKETGAVIDASRPGENQVSKASAPKIFDHMEQKIFGATDWNALLEIHTVKGIHMTLKHICQTVFSLGMLVKKAPSETAGQDILQAIIRDARFGQICGTLQSAHFENNPQLLLIAIQGLMNIGVPSDSLVLKTLENELKWVVRRCPIKVVAKAVAMLTAAGSEITMKASNTKLDSSHPLIVAVHALQRRWVEVTTGTEFIAACQVISYLSDETRSRLEDRAVEFVQDFTPMEMIKIFIAIGNQKRRPTPLLRALAFHLSKSPEKIPAKDMIELIYALNALNFADPVLMGRLSNELHPEIDTVTNPALISSLVTSLGQLRYKHTELLVAVEDWIMKHLDELRPFDAAAWLLTCSVLNVTAPKENVTLFCTKAKKLLESTKLTNPIGWVNIVHALTVLNQVDSTILSASLDPALVAKIDELGDKKNLIGVKSKLLNLNAVSKTLKDYNGHNLSSEILAKWSPGVIVSSDEKLSTSVLESLHNFLPPPKYLLGSQALPSGVFVDAVCKLNNKLDPVPVDSKEGVSAIKVAVVVQGYPSFTLGLKEPTGPTSLNVRLLENEGYTVVAVPYTEFHPQEKLLRKVQYLEQRMRSIQVPSKAKESTKLSSASSTSQSKSSAISGSSNDSMSKSQQNKIDR